MAKPTFLQSLLGGVAQGAVEQVPKYFEKKKEESLMQKRNEALKTMGLEDLIGLDPELQKVALSENLKGNRQRQNLQEKNSLIGDIYKNSSSGSPENEEVNEGKYDPANTSDEDIARITAIDPALGKEARAAKDSAIQQKQASKKQEFQEKQFFHKESEKYYNSLQESKKNAESKNRAIDRQLENVDKIGWWDRAVSALAGNSPYGDLLKSSTAQQLDANTLAQLQGQRELLGGILSDSDIRLLMQKIVTSSKDPEANKVIGANMKLENDLSIAKAKIANEIMKENKGYRPANFIDEIEERYNEKYGDQIRKSFEQVMSLPDDPERLEKVYRRKVHPGTPLNEEIIDNYYKIAKKNAQLATKMAREDGYDVPD